MVPADEQEIGMGIRIKFFFAHIDYIHLFLIHIVFSKNINDVSFWFKGLRYETEIMYFFQVGDGNEFREMKSFGNFISKQR